MRLSLKNLTVVILEFNIPWSGGRDGKLLEILAQQLLQLIDVVDGAPQSFHLAGLVFQVGDVEPQISKPVIDPPDSGPLPEVPLDDTGRLLFLDTVMMFHQGRAVILQASAVSAGRNFTTEASLDLPAPRLRLLAVVLTQRSHRERQRLLLGQTHLGWLAD